MRGLLRGQTIRIDDHRSGTNQPKNWDDPSAEVHLDKRTKWGKGKLATIKIPINSNREPYCTLNNERDSSFRRRLNKEIKKAFQDIEKRQRFVEEIVRSIRNFDSQLSDREKAQIAVKRVAKAFDLEETIIREMVVYADKQIMSFASLHTDIDGGLYFIQLTHRQITIGELSNQPIFRLIDILF